MTEVLFYLSVGFVGYVVYVLVDEQRGANPGLPVLPAASLGPETIKPPRNTAARAKAKPKKAAAPKQQKPPSVDSSPDAILVYLGKHGITTIAKLARELPDSRKILEERIGLLIKAGSISQTTVGRAKAVGLIA
jgi:hypothetical protein